MKKNFLFGLLALMLAGFGFGGISMAAESKLPELTTTITDGKVGIPQEFSFSTVANDYDGVNIIAKSQFDNDAALESLYYIYNGQKIDILNVPESDKGNFGGNGFPLADATSNFEVTFKTAGTYTFTVQLVDASNQSTIYTGLEKSITISEKTLPELTTTIADGKVGVPQEFSFSTVANDYDGVNVIAKSQFDNDAALESLYYIYNGQKIDILNVPESDKGNFGGNGFPLADATSNFEVTFKTAGTYTFTVQLVDASNQSTIYTGLEKSITISALEPTKEFVTATGNKIPVVYTEEGENITISEEETKALLGTLLSQVPTQDPTGTRTLLERIIAANSFDNLVEIKKIDDDYVLFVNAGRQTKGFIQSGSTLTFNPHAFKNGTPISEGTPISYDISKTVKPSRVTPAEEKVTTYNTVSKDGTEIGYTLNMNNDNDGWFYAPKMYTITFNKANCPAVDNTTAGEAPTAVNNNCNPIETKQYAYGSQVERTGEAPSKANDADCTTSYKFTGWSPALNIVTGDATYVAQYECTPKSSGSSSGGGGGGSSSSYSCKNLPSNATANNSTKPRSNTNYSYDTDTSKVCTFQCNKGYTWNEKDSKCEKAEATTGDTADEPKTDDNQSPLDDGLTQELHDAYDFAHENGVTTMPTAAEANMYGPLTRIAMAKMLSKYAMNVLGQKPANIVVPEFPDVTSELNEEYSNAVTLAYQLGIMGINIQEFRPYDNATRAEFGTALSRMLFSTPDGEEYEGTAQYYVNHLKKLVEEKIITNANPNLQELRGYVMIMLMRAAE